MLNHYVISGENKIVKVLKDKEGKNKKGNPYRMENGKFARNKKIDKSINMYLCNGETGESISKEAYDERLGWLLLCGDKNKENEEDNKWSPSDLWKKNQK